MRWWRLLFCLVSLLALVIPSPTWSANTHGYSQEAQERGAWFAEALSPYVVQGCLPTTSGTTTIGTMACRAYVGTTDGPLVYVTQPTHTIGPLSSGDGVYWLAIHRDMSTVVTDWTRQTGTHYLWRKNATQPADPSGGMIVAQLTVSGAAITGVVDIATRVFTQPVVASTAWVTGATSVWIFQAGATFTPNAAVVIGGRIRTQGRQAIFLPGSGALTFAATFQQAVEVDWFGADYTGITDVSAAVNLALAALPLRGHLHFGAGRYLATAGFTAQSNSVTTGVDAKTVRITCAGRDVTQIQFTPTAPATLWSLTGTGISQRMPSASLEDCAIYSAGTQTKTILALGYVDGFVLQRVLMNNSGAGAGDTTSVGIHIDKDPQIISITDVVVLNYPHPMVLGTATVVQTIDHLRVDHLEVLNVLQNPSVNALIEVKDGTQLQQVTFRETVGVGGNGLFKWNGLTTATTDQSRTVVFEGGRYEDGGLTTAGRTFSIEPHATKKLVNLRIAGMVLGTPGAGTNLYLRNVLSSTVQDVYAEANTPATLYNFDDTNDNVLFLNFTSTALLPTEVVGGTMKKIFGAARRSEVPNSSEPIKFYQTVDATKGIAAQYWQIMNHRVYTANPTLASGATFTIPPSNGAVFAMQVMVAFNANTGTAGGCHVAMFADTADTTSVKLSGTSNCVGAIPGAGEVGVYRNTGDDSIKVVNSTVVTKTLSILVFYIPTPALP